MGQEEIVLKVEADLPSAPQHHRRESSNCSGAKISNSSATSSPSRRKENVVKVKFSRHPNKEPSGDVKSDEECLSCDRLSPEVQRGDSIGMLPSDAKGQNNDYGSFCNTPHDRNITLSSSSRGSSACSVGSLKNDGKGKKSTNNNDPVSESVKDHESVISNDSYQCQPLLPDIPSGSSSEEEVGNSNGYIRRKARVKPGTVRLEMESEDDHDVDEDDSAEYIPAEPHKTLMAFVFLVVAWIATTTSLALTHERVPDIDPLPDVFLDNVVYQSWGLDTSEILIIISTWIAFVVVLFNKNRFIVFRRIFLIVGIHYYYRAVTMYITVLPKADPNYQCAPKLNGTTALEIAQRVLKLLSGMGLSINGQHIYCGDYIYSGHTMSLIMTYLVITQYSPKNWFLLHWSSWVLALTGIVTLLLSRGHYSIDVLIAYYITTRLWWIYHTLAHNAHLERFRGGKHNFFTKLWWFPIFRYFEGSVPPKPLKREFNWPIPNRIKEFWAARRNRPPSPLPN